VSKRGNGNVTCWARVDAASITLTVNVMMDFVNMVLMLNA